MSVSHLGLRLLSLVLLGTLAGQASATQASLPEPGDLDLIRDRQERLLEEQRRRLEELQEHSLIRLMLHGLSHNHNKIISSSSRDIGPVMS